MKNNPILIGGCGSTGSTLLREVLNEHPDIYAGPELSIFDRPILYTMPFPELRDRILNADFEPFDQSMPFPIRYGDGRSYFGLAPWGIWKEYIPDKDRLEFLLKNSSSTKEFIVRFFEEAKGEKRTWAEKTPGNLFCIDEWLDMFPNGKVILTQRNIWDTVTSLIVNRGFDPHAAMNRWSLSDSQIIQCEGHTNVTVVDFNGLLEHTESVLQNLYEWLEVDSSECHGARQVGDNPQTYLNNENSLTKGVKRAITLLDEYHLTAISI